MRRLIVLALLCASLFLGIYEPAQAASLVAGRMNVPPNMVSRLANSTISNLYGLPLGTAGADGSFNLPPSPVNDVEIIFVRPPHSDDVTLMGIVDGDRYTIGIEGTALAMLLMHNPINGALDVNGKRDLIKAARSHPDFFNLTQAIQRTLDNQSDLTSVSDAQIVSLLNRIQANLPQPHANILAYDPLSSANY